MKKSDGVALFTLGVAFICFIGAISCFKNGIPEYGIKLLIGGGVGVSIWAVIKIVFRK